MNKNSNWPDESLEIAKDLHSKLSLNHENWHKLKGNAKFRAAELLTSAILQLLQNGSANDIDDLINQSSKWLKGELKDPGCPHR